MDSSDLVVANLKAELGESASRAIKLFARLSMTFTSETGRLLFSVKISRFWQPLNRLKGTAS